MTTAPPQPRSWAEDCNTYREVRGSRSYGYIAPSNSHASTSGRNVMTAAPKRYPRTNKVPFAETTHPLYPYDDQNGAADTGGDPAISKIRYDRHGWGDTTLLKQDGYMGVPHPHEGGTNRPGKRVPPHPMGPDGRTDLFGVLQMTQQGQKDGWIGHRQIDPDTGKRAVGLPPDPRGRRDLFDVLHARNPGVPDDDSWLGNKLVDPSKRKGNPPGPEMRRGRPDLFEVFNQGILREPLPRKYDLLKRGVDPIGDGWIGNHLVHPASGKMPPEGHVTASDNTMRGPTFKDGVPEGWSDMPKPHKRAVPPPFPVKVDGIINGSCPVEPPPPGGKMMLPEPKGATILPTRPDNLYSHMTYKPLSAVESSVLKTTYDDGRYTNKRNGYVAPGSQEPGKGSSMLHWNDKQRIGNFVRVGGLAQEGRKVKQPSSTL